MLLSRYFLFAYIILCLIIPAAMHNAFAQDSAEEQAITSWNTDLKSIENAILEAESLDDVTEYRKSLRMIDDEAAAQAEAIKETLESKQNLVASFGEAPEDSTQEDPSITKERDRLQSAIAEVDAVLKRTNSTRIQVSALLSQIDAVETDKLRNYLLTRHTIPLSQDGFASLKENTRHYIAQFQNWRGLLLLLSGAILIIGSSLVVTRYFNEVLLNATNIELIRPISRKRLSVLLLAAYLVFLNRFSLTDIEQNAPILDYLLKSSTTIILSLLIYTALGKFRFISTHTDKEDRLGERTHQYSWLWNSIRRLTRLVAITIPVICIAGYVNLGLYLVLNILATLAAILAFIWLRQLLLDSITKAVTHTKELPRDGTAYSPITVAIVEPMLALFLFGCLLLFWGMTSDDITLLVERYKHGIPIGDTVINFSSLFAALFLFFALYLVTRLSQWFLSNRVFPQTTLDTGLRDAILAVMGYCGIIIAVLIAMGALGLDLSNLAIVAGALSVGIGFGLQAIFSNFVSGLILLFERPVKVGDWIIVGGNEGMIKKIRVRSTEIETFQNASIIVPNSQLISETVTNWTLHDRVGRVDVPVGVAYGTNTEQVKEVLIETALAHPKVRRHPAPQVIFTNFGDSSLDFELRCFLGNIRDIFRVTSELRFAIDAAFREHNIEIPFPQRDIHIITPKEGEEEKDIKETHTTPIKE